MDAERAAGEVSLYNKFPLKFPKQWLATAAIFLAALLVAELMPPLHLFSKPGTGEEQAIGGDFAGASR